MDVNLKVIHFSVANQEQSTKFNSVEILQGATVFLLGTLLYVSPDQVIGHFNDVFYKFFRHWLRLNLSVKSLTMLVSSGLTSPPPVDININKNSRFFRNKKLDYHYPQTKVIIKVSNHLTR